ncbi:endonuclease/exonuclease/phosphatase family protein [Candidatus Parcubacteria bacterium]|nr:endonuclease/exonuclease/phosphatase family protein [Candidatus Parcubacteria bacterium]
MKVITFNTAYSQQKQQLADRLQRTKADIILLQEVGGGNSGEDIKDVSGFLSKRLGMFARYAPEFEEQKDRTHTGNLILTRYQYKYESLELKQLANWNPPIISRPWTWVTRGWFEPRIGQRVAQIMLCQVGKRRVAVINLHLESKVSSRMLTLQIKEVLEAVRQKYPNIPAIIAGDFNSNCVNIPCECLPIKELQNHEFKDALGDVSQIEKRFTTYCKLVGTKKISDWIFYRWLNIVPGSGETDHSPLFQPTLSDHSLLSAEFNF